MPTERFLNLPQQKRERIVEAAIKELSRVPYTEASINRIIKVACIPRGSFYQYFEDKDDLVDYILGDYMAGLEQVLENSITVKGEDLFRMFEQAFLFTVEYGMEPERFAYCRNIFSYLMTMVEGPVEIVNRMNKIHIYQKYRYSIDLSGLRYSSEQDMQDILEILITLLRSAIAQVFADVSQLETVKKSFTNKLAILKNGILKQGAEDGNV